VAAVRVRDALDLQPGAPLRVELLAADAR
jgi:hypothetical protein